VGVGNVRGSGLNQTKQINVFFYHFQHIHWTLYIWGRGCVGVRTFWSLLDPPLYRIHFNIFIHYEIAIPYYTNSLGYIRSQQLVNNIQSMVRKKKKLYLVV
jgi:hypothetical protein